LEQQTATAEVLGVINSSPGNLSPVFDKVLERAVALCEAAFGSMLLYDGEHFDTVAVRGVPAAFADYVKTDRPVHGPGTGPARILAGERVVHIADLAAEEPYRAGDPQRRALVDLGGARSLVCVPLLRDDAILGIIAVYRQEVRLFSEKQIALLQNFAAQAVIAMENARLLTETREALEQQTATTEVLQVINRSPGNLAPVYDVILEKARNLCGVPIGNLALYDGEQFRAAALHGIPEQFLEEARRPFHPGRAHERLVRGERLVHIRDFLAVASVSGSPASRALVSMGVRTTLLVPLRKESVLLGYICRQPAGGPTVLRKRDRAARKFRSAGGNRHGQCPAIGRNPPAPGGAARHLRQYGRRCGDVRQRAAARRVEPQFPTDYRPPRRTSGGAAELC